LEEGGLLAFGEVADQGVVDGVGVDLHGAIGDRAALVRQVDDDGPAIVGRAGSFDQAAIDEAGDEAAESGLAKQDGLGQIVHAHLLARVEPEVEQDVEVADRQATVPAELGGQATCDAVMGNAEGLPGASALGVLGFGFWVLGWLASRFRASAPLRLNYSPARLLAVHPRHSTGQ
jgi:hypothetical protein